MSNEDRITRQKIEKSFVGRRRNGTSIQLLFEGAKIDTVMSANKDSSNRRVDQG